MSHKNLTESYLQGVTFEQLAVEQLVECLVKDAINQEASDIHVEPWDDSIVVRMRVSGQLVEWIHMPLELKEKISGRFKVIAGMASHLSGVPQDGKATLGETFGMAQLRVSIIPTINGEKIVCRILDPSRRAFDINKLGIDERTLDVYVELLDKPNGLILLNGPTGSGKTTVIYSSLCHLINQHGTTISIASVEDPVEVPVPTVSQVQLNPAADFHFAGALRALMRQDPEVIMVGEIRDPETAAIAVQAGLTGHLVISTVHSGTTAGVFARLINMNIEPFLLASSLLGVLGMRLLRKNCEHCLELYHPSEDLLNGLTQEQRETAHFRRGRGCGSCQETGFAGQMPLTELMVVDDDIRDAVLQKRATRHIQQIALEKGMPTLWDSGLRKALAGETTLEEVSRRMASDQF